MREKERSKMTKGAMAIRDFSTRDLEIDRWLVSNSRRACMWPPFWTASFLIRYEYELMRKIEPPRCTERRRK